MIYDYRQAAESNKQSAMCILLAMARGKFSIGDKILFQYLLRSVDILDPIYTYIIIIKKKAIPLQTETRLMLDTAWKAHQGGMYLKISERKHVIFKAQGHFFHNRLIDLPYISPADTDKD